MDQTEYYQRYFYLAIKYNGKVTVDEFIRINRSYYYDKLTLYNMALSLYPECNSLFDESDFIRMSYMCSLAKYSDSLFEYLFIAFDRDLDSLVSQKSFSNILTFIGLHLQDEYIRSITKDPYISFYKYYKLMRNLNEMCNE